MPINRRTAIRQLFIISAGAAILPACVNDKKTSAQTFSNLPVTADEQALLEDMASAIIPTTDTPGAKEVGAHLFALRMVNDCYKKKDREKFLSGLRSFAGQVQQQQGKPFEKCTAAEKEAILGKAGDKKNGEENAYFFNTFKRLTIQAYTSSEYYLTKVDVYKLVPGKFISSVKV